LQPLTMVLALQSS